MLSNHIWHVSKCLHEAVASDGRIQGKDEVVLQKYGRKNTPFGELIVEKSTTRGWIQKEVGTMAWILNHATMTADQELTSEQQRELHYVEYKYCF